MYKAGETNLAQLHRSQEGNIFASAAHLFGFAEALDNESVVACFGKISIALAASTRPLATPEATPADTTHEATGEATHKKPHKTSHEILQNNTT